MISADEVLATMREDVTILNVLTLAGDTPDGGKLLKFAQPETQRCYTFVFSADGWEHFRRLVNGIQIADSIPFGNGVPFPTTRG